MSRQNRKLEKLAARLWADIGPLHFVSAAALGYLILDWWKKHKKKIQAQQDEEVEDTEE
jgi:hypothetical protein